jgi:hypothetical protein
MMQYPAAGHTGIRPYQGQPPATVCPLRDTVSGARGGPDDAEQSGVERGALGRGDGREALVDGVVAGDRD